MGFFDDGMELSVEAEIAEMGEVVYLDGAAVEGVVTDVTEGHVQSAGGRRDVVSFSVFVSKVDGKDVKKGCKVEAGGRRGRVLRREALGGGGWELVCGPVSSWNGRVPGV